MKNDYSPIYIDNIGLRPLTEEEITLMMGYTRNSSFPKPIKKKEIEMTQNVKGTFYDLHHGKSGSIMIAQMDDSWLSNMVIFLLKQLWELQINGKAEFDSLDPISQKVVGKMYQQYQKDQDNRMIGILAKLSSYWLEFSLRGLATPEMIKFLQDSLGRAKALPTYGAVSSEQFKLALPAGIEYDEDFTPDVGQYYED